MINYEIDEKVLEQSLDTFGKYYILNVVQEELAELIQAISKYRRYGRNIAFDHIQEEVADVLICIDYLYEMALVDEEEVQIYIDNKLERQKERNKEELQKGL